MRFYFLISGWLLYVFVCVGLYNKKISRKFLFIYLEVNICWIFIVYEVFVKYSRDICDRDVFDFFRRECRLSGML